MKWIVGCLVVLMAGSTFAQRDLTPNSRKSAFGKRDFRNLRNVGWQIQLGPTFMMTKLKNTEESFSIGNRTGTYTLDPSGRPGAYAEIGLAHFPKKRSKLSLKLKTILVSYYDWGVGFKLLGGRESADIRYTDATGGVAGGTGEYYNGYAYGRFSIHKNIHFKKAKNFFLDNSLGINVDYRVMHGNQAYRDDATSSPAAIGVTTSYHNPLLVQLHYGLGFGFRLKRGAYLIPGVRTPILGYQATVDNPGSKRNVFGKPSMHWFSSRYWPILVHVKLINLFEKKNKKGCPPAEINDQDRNTQQGR